MNFTKAFGLAALTSVAVFGAGGAYAGCGHCQGDEQHTHQTKGADIVDTAVSARSFGTLVAAVKAAGLVETLKSEGPFTVFAPTDEAFGQLPEGTVASLLKPENKAKLQAVLTYHVVPGRLSAAEIVQRDSLSTVGGADLRLQLNGGQVRVNDARVIQNDVRTTNGVIHVIDRVLLPPDTAEDPKQAVRKLIELAISRGAPMFNAGDPEACTAIYEVAAVSIHTLGDDVVSDSALDRLSRSLEKARATDNPENQAWILRRALDDVHASLKSIDAKATAFTPIMEAELPEGFPGTGPVGEVVIKDYPAHRAAIVAGKRGQNGAFMSLFGHIKRNGIAMTTPVAQTVAEDGRSFSSMAFVYQSPTIGATGMDRNVEVMDVAAGRVISIGMIGTARPNRIQAAARQIEQWLAEDGEHEAAGPLRVMGYNSPFIPEHKRFTEVQLPIRLVES